MNNDNFDGVSHFTFLFLREIKDLEYLTNSSISNILSGEIE
jgi:hypothetical protein